PLSAAYAPLAEAKGLDWRVVPFTGTVRSDRVLLGRMLRNLVDNAIRYTDRGRVMVDCRPQGTRLCIEVHDTGLGIPPEQRER
ncbi:HAMP domain-containing sensor histidine kinase, partial [Burkholderia sp. SIMBA_057]